MRPRSDLFLVRENLLQLAETTYFTRALHDFTYRLMAAVDHVLSNEALYSPDIVRSFAAVVRATNTYLSGSTVKEAPYEMEYCLRQALRTWVGRSTIITTALTENQNFHLLPIDPWAEITKTISGFDTRNYDPLLVLIGVPRLYRHFPIYCIPLYHELGHFVDLTLGVTAYSFLLSPFSHPMPFMLEVETNYRKEHFADLFAACYAGSASIETLETIAPNAGQSATHPATADRSRVVRNFLAGTNEPIIDLFQAALASMGAPTLAIRFDAVDVSPEFNDVRPHRLADEAKMHGIFPAAWRYLSDALTKRNKGWISDSTTDSEIEAVVNNLTEKSIRNIAIREKWESGAST